MRISDFLRINSDLIDPLRALTFTLESYSKRFLYDFSFSSTGEKESTGELIEGSFEYRAQLEPVKS